MRTSEPSGLNSARDTRPRCPFSVSSERPLRASQIRAVPSLLAVTIRRSSGLNRADGTQLRCPRSTMSVPPVRASETRAVASRLGVRIRRPSLLKLTPLAQPP